MITTPKEWADYVNRLSGMTLLSKAHAANSVTFVDTLLDEGVEMPAIDDIFVLFCRRIAATGQEPLSGGMLDLKYMMVNDKEYNKIKNKEVTAEDSIDPDLEYPDNMDEQFALIDLAASWEEEDQAEAESALESTWDDTGIL